MRCLWYACVASVVGVVGVCDRACVCVSRAHLQLVARYLGGHAVVAAKQAALVHRELEQDVARDVLLAARDAAQLVGRGVRASGVYRGICVPLSVCGVPLSVV